MEPSINPPLLFSECQLIHSLKKHERIAFSYLYDHYSGALFSIITNIITDQETAQDVLQKVFLNIWQKMEAYEPAKGRLFTWMLNIARNAAIDTLRSKNFRKQQLIQPIADTHSTQPAHQTWTKSDGIGLHKYVARLKPQQRMLVELVYFHGYTQPEIAAMQSVPLSTIKTRIRAALFQLRSLLGPMEAKTM